MSLMKIALAQFNPTVGDFEGNRARILALARTANLVERRLAVFPELCICGYPPQDLIERPAFVEWNQKELACLAWALWVSRRAIPEKQWPIGPR
jgi:NAD+ synthase (glutamine-hydrolysing)